MIFRMITNSSTLTNATCWTRLAIVLHRVEWSLISIKHLMEYRSTFLLFSSVNKRNWPRTSTLSHLRKHSKSSLRQGQWVVSPKIWGYYLPQVSDLHNSSLHHTTCCIRLATQSNTIQQRWMMLRSFGQDLITQAIFENPARWLAKNYVIFLDNYLRVNTTLKKFTQKDGDLRQCQRKVFGITRSQFSFK